MKTLLALSLALSAYAAPDAEALYNKNCAACHDASLPRVPARAALKALAPEAIVRALVSGAMRIQGMALSAEERTAVAQWLSGKPLGAAKLAPTGLCKAGLAPASDAFAHPLWSGWGGDAENSRSETSAQAGLDAAQVKRLKLKWAFGFPGDFVAYAQPAIAGGRLFVGSAGGTVYSLDASTGCIYWTFEGVAGVRSAISLGPIGARTAAYFSDLQANAYALDAATGQLIWKAGVGDHPTSRGTGSPKLFEGRLYVPVATSEEWASADPRYECCTSRGAVVALDASTGRQIWKTHTIADAAKPTSKNKIGTQLYGPSGGGVWGSPTIDVKRRALYVGTGDSYSEPSVRTTDAILAMDLDTGKLLWSRQLTEGDIFTTNCLQPVPASCPATMGPDADFGSSVILRQLPGGKRALLAGQKSGVMHALDPDQQGEVLWQTRVGTGGLLGGIQWGSAADSERVYVPVSDLGIVITDASKIQANGGFGPDPNKGGGLFALRIDTGAKIWQTTNGACGRPSCSPAQSAAVTLIPGVVFSGSVDGSLRAYSSAGGTVIWDADTAREFTTVNGVPAHGGSIDGPGPVVANGIVYLNSGYGLFNAMPGNVLLAFSVDGK